MKIKAPIFPIDFELLEKLSPESIDYIIKYYRLQVDEKVIKPAIRFSEMYFAVAVYLRTTGVTNNNTIEKQSTLSRKISNYKMGKLEPQLSEFKNRSKQNIDKFGFMELSKCLSISSELNDHIRKFTYKDAILDGTSKWFFFVCRTLILALLFSYTYILGNRASETLETDINPISIHLTLFIIGVIFLTPVQDFILNSIRKALLQKQLNHLKEYPEKIIEGLYAILLKADISILIADDLKN